MRYDDAVASLYQAPVEQFVAERKRLAGELKATGDKPGAARLAKLARPPISAWVVDQLWWQARAAFDALFETAERLRAGQLDATPAHRDALARLRAHAAKLLGDAGHAATDATLRRVTQTLSALAAIGSWDPDPPGALSADRDPPGFEAIGISNAVEPAAPNPPPTTAATRPAEPEPAAAGAPAAAAEAQHRRELEATAARAEAQHRRELEATAARAEAQRRRELEDAAARAEAQRRRELEDAAARAEAAAAVRRADAERARAAAERHRLEAALRTAEGDVAQREREVAWLERELAAARDQVTQATAIATGLAERLAQLDR
jgi:hypothetical protein